MSKRIANAAVPQAQRTRRKEPVLTQIASFVDLFVWLLLLKSFFLPLFIIPTGSMAETLMGAHTQHTCPNCGYEFPADFHAPSGPSVVQCPNCRYQQETRLKSAAGVKIRSQAGDRIVVHGWPFVLGGMFGPQRWDVVVFKNPNEPDINFIKRLIGLPGETIEIIDGDVFVKKPGENALHPARKTPQAQDALWFPYYDHDYPPREPTADRVYARATQSRGGRTRWPTYLPRWVEVSDGGWLDLDSRTPRFEGLEAGCSSIEFVTRTGPDVTPGRILDIYGYNGDSLAPYFNVTDVRLSADVRISDGDGFVGLSVSKYDDFFTARLYADGRLTLVHSNGEDGEQQEWGTTQVSPPDRFRRFSIGHADYRVAVQVDGRTVLVSTPEQYSVSAEEARRRSMLGVAPTIRVSAEHVRASLAHLLIARDVHYTSGLLRNRTVNGGGEPGTGTQGHAITLRDDAYFVCGDNSPRSHDSRAWSERDLGPHLRGALEEGRYTVGTVPADQMIGKAFFVYWPGFQPLTEKGPNLLPDFGRVRWIR